MVTLLRSLLLVTAVLGADIASAQGRILNVLLLDGTDVALSESTGEVDTSFLSTVDITASVTDITATFTDKEFDTGAFEVQTFTFEALADTTAGDYITFSQTGGTTWAISMDKTGADPEPTGALWVAVDAARKTHCDVSGATTAADVAAAAELCVDALTGFTAVITSADTGADGTMTMTQLVPGVVAAAVPKNADDSGAGGITYAETTPGTATEVDLTNNVVTIPTHAYPTGMKLQLTTTGTLPTGVTTATDYYVIAASSSTIGFASSQANALAGTKIDLTGYGAGVHTVAVEDTIAGTIKLQKNNEPKGATAVWFDVTNSSQNITTTGNLNWALTDVGYRSLRAVVAVTEGVADVDLRLNAKQ